MNDPDENAEPRKKKEKMDPKVDPKAVPKVDPKVDSKTESSSNDVLLRDKSNLACSFVASDKV